MLETRETEKNKLWYVSTNSLFMSLSEREQQAMASMMEADRVKKKGLVYIAGDKSDKVYVLKEGRIKITRLSSDGRELTVDLLEPGDIFGELSIAGEQERETSAEALEDSMICAVGRKEFEALVGSNPGFSLAITRLIGFRLRRVELRLEDLIFRDVCSRLKGLLADMAVKYGQKSVGGTRIRVKLTHQEIANLIGSSRETVTLEVNNLKKEGLLLTEGRHFIVTERLLSENHPLKQ